VLEIVKARLEGMAALFEDMDVASAEELTGRLLKAKTVFVIGRGRSGYVAESFAMRLMQMGLDVHVPGEATCPRIKPGDVMVAISCSGTTATPLQLAKIARDAGAEIVAITAVPKSPITEFADHVMIVPVTERSVVQAYKYVLGPINNTLFEEAVFLFLDALVYSILEREGIPKKRLSERHTNLE